MASVYVTVVTLLATVTLGGTRGHFGDAGSELWGFAAQAACASSGVAGYETARTTAWNCTEELFGPTSEDLLAICGKKKERNDCLRPYYDLIKTCFCSDAQKKQVDKAFNIHYKGVDYLCEDNGKRLKEFTEKDRCEAKVHTDCSDRFAENITADETSLFNIHNCRTMHWMVKCAATMFDHCESSVADDITAGVMNAVLRETPCGEVSGVSSSLNACVASSLFFALVYHAVMMFLL